MPADAGCALYSWDWGETPPQPCHELQLPCQQSTFDEGALWQSPLDPLTVSKPMADSTPYSKVDLGQPVPVDRLS